MEPVQYELACPAPPLEAGDGALIKSHLSSSPWSTLDDSLSSPWQCARLDLRSLRFLASMPFLDRLELAAVSGTPDRTTHDAVARLKRRGLVDSVRHATDVLVSTRRLYVTRSGLRWLAENEGADMDELLQRYPVSAHWRRILLSRLDAVGAIYRLASTIAALRGSSRFRWYRRAPMDAALVLPDRRVIGIVRQGATSDRTGFSKRVWRRLEGPEPYLLLMLAPDEARLRHAQELLRRASFPATLALEGSAAMAASRGQVWRLPSSDRKFDLRAALSPVRLGGMLTRESPLSNPLVPPDLEVPDTLLRVPDHLLPPSLSQRRSGPWTYWPTGRGSRPGAWAVC